MTFDFRMTFNFHPKGLLKAPHLRYRYLWAYVGLSMVLAILTFSLIDIPASVAKFLWSDKLLHGVAYAGLMGWFAQIFRHDLTRLILVVGFIGLGVSIEFLQALTPKRSFDVLDMIANTSGIVLAWALSYTVLGTVLVRFEALMARNLVKVKLASNWVAKRSPKWPTPWSAWWSARGSARGSTKSSPKLSPEWASKIASKLASNRALKWAPKWVQKIGS